MLGAPVRNDVETGHAESRAREVRGHRRAHDSEADHSHRLLLHRSLFFCWSAGKYATILAQKKEAEWRGRVGKCLVAGGFGAPPSSRRGSVLLPAPPPPTSPPTPGRIPPTSSP